MAFKKTKTWFCTFEYRYGVFGTNAEQRHVCHVRIHDPEDSFGGRIEKTTWRSPVPSLALELQVRYSLDLVPTLGAFYKRELHVSQVYPNAHTIKMSSWFAIREGVLYFAPDFTELAITRHAIAFYLWETGEKEIMEKAAARAATKSA